MNVCVLQVAHEDWSLLYQYYHRRKHDLTNDWLRDRRELLTKCRVVFEEVVAAYRLAQRQDNLREQQLQLCNELFDKVTMATITIAV